MANLNLKGLWIPIEILTDKNLSDKEKTILSIILFLSKENNTEEEALKTINEVFNEYQIPFNNIECAKQREKTKVVTI